MDYRGPDNDTVMVTVEEEGKKTAQQLVGEAVLGTLLQSTRTNREVVSCVFSASWYCPCRLSVWPSQM